MDTERPSPRYSGIDLWEPMDVLDAMIEGQFAAVAAAREARFGLERAAAAIEARLKHAGRLVYVGAGTSGRLAVQDGAELVPTFNWPQDRLLLLIAGGRDALIAVAASGTTPFTLACLREAKRRGALTVGIANNRDTPILNEADHAIFLDTGPEPIAGSTRMKAGTAQRIALNMLSSLLMIRLGRVYEGLMVDVLAVNQKLMRRSEEMLLKLTAASLEDVRQALQQANGNVKLAVLLLRGCTMEKAQALLDRAHGELRAALQLLELRGSDAA